MVTQNANGTFSSIIDGREYTFEMYEADKSFMVLCQISAILGEGLHYKGLAEGASKQEAIVSLALQAAQGLLRGIGGNATNSLRLMKQLTCDGVLCDGKPLTERAFAQHFRGQLGHLLNVAAAAMEVQYANFFDWLAPNLALIKTAAQANSSP